MQMHPFTVLGSLFLAGCASTGAVLHSSDLEYASALIEAGDYKGSARVASALHSDSAEAHDTVARSLHFGACAALARAHSAASFHNQFLAEVGSARGSEYRLDQDPATPVKLGSPVGHVVASLYWSARARAAFTALAVPDEPERAELAFVNLCELSGAARLSFQDRVDEILAGMSELASPSGCEALLQRARVLPAMRPWIYKGVFDALKRGDEPTAYRFAIRALDTAVDSKGSFSKQTIEQLASWVTSGSRYAFKCPTCKSIVDPMLSGCTVCRRPNVEFEPELRAR